MKTLFELMEEYLEWRRSLKLSFETIRKNRKGIFAFVTWLKDICNVLTVDQIRKSHLHAWQRHLSAKTNREGLPIQQRTINAYNESIKGMLKYLAGSGYIQSGLAEEIHYVKNPQRLPGSVLTHAQMRKMLNKIPLNDLHGYRDRAMLEVLYSSGVRATELLTLNIEDVDYKNLVMKVTGKGDKQRMVPIGKTALKHLETYVKAIRPHLLKNTDNRAMFLSMRGNRVIYRGLLDRIHSCARNSGLDQVSAHTFRRSCTTELIRGGANIYHVKELLGHESLDTLRHYTRLTILDLKKTHAKCHPREKDFLA